jgi:branched-chain amino acid aminotransferase
MEMPYNLKNDRIKQEIVKLLHKNRHLKGAWVRITVFRNKGGSFTPTDDSCSYLIESHKLNNDVYKLNEKGLIVDVYQEHKKPVSPLSTLQTTNALINILAGTFQKAHNLDNCLLINQKNELTEAIDSNLFLVMGDYIKTPPLKSGCVDGIIRKKIFDLSWELGYKISHQHPVFYEDLMNADEMFLTNAVEGIKWVSGIRKKRYFKNTAKKLMALLNEKTRIDRY